MIKTPGRQPTRSQQLARHYESLVPARFRDEVTIVHHVTEDTPKRLQVEVERRYPGGITFERVVL
jgi:hypothetical protein